MQPLEHRNWIRCVRWQCLSHIPVLHNTRPIHAVDIRQRNGRLICLINSHVCESNVVIKAHAKYGGWHEWDDVRELGGIGSAPLSVKGVVLGEVHGDVLVEGSDDILGDVEVVDEVEKDLALVCLGRWMAWAVGCCRVGPGLWVGVMALVHRIVRE